MGISMGMRLFSDCCISKPESYTNPNPNPFRFSIEDAWYYGGYAVLKVHYPDCTTFNGRKILVLKGWTPQMTQDATELDPHFLSKDGMLRARFPADSRGWEDAVNFVKGLK